MGTPQAASQQVSRAARPGEPAEPSGAPAGTAGGATTSILVPVSGMTCRSCERRIERSIGTLPNVQRVAASAVRGRVEIVADGPVPSSAVRTAIEDAGYRIGRSPWLTHDSRVWLTAVGGVALVIAIVGAAQVTGITELASATGDISRGGLLVALLLGLAAGVSTCLALTGGLVLALSAAFAARGVGGGDPALSDRLRPGVLFVAGRVVGFAILGALLGALGASVTLPPPAVAALMITVALLMTILGVRLTGVSPRVAAWSPTVPSGPARRLGLDAGSVTAYSDSRATLLGAASFFLPCGFTQAVQVYALSTGSPLAAGAIMAVFALGTAPGLLALAGLPTLLPAGMRPALLRVVGVVVLGFAVINGIAGFRLVGISPSLVASSAPATPPIVTEEDGVQVLRTFQIATGYMPENASLYAGVPTRWIVESLEGRSCAIFLQVPSLGLAVTLHEGENVINLPPLEPGRVEYTCSMGMYGGTLTVVERQQGAREDGSRP